LLHRNDERNEGYTGFLTDIIDRALECAGDFRQAVDWGSGPKPVAAKLLARRGVETVLWDPFFADSHRPQKESCDAAFCIETAEHFAEPRRDFQAFAETLKPGGWGFVHTRIAPRDDADFLAWWYVQDITHISFYSAESLRILGDMASLSLVRIEGDSFAVFRRPLPVLVAGGINLDIEGRPYRAPILRDSNPGRIHFSPGGCARNMAENLSRLGTPAELVTAAGDDVFGEGLIESTKAAGVGVEGVALCQGSITSTYLSLLDERGDMTAAVSGMDIFDNFTPRLVEPALERAVDSACKRSFGGDSQFPFSKLLLDGNLLPETSLYIHERFPDLPCWLDPVSVMKTRRIAEYQDGILFKDLEGIKLNALEANALIGNVCVEPVHQLLNRLKPHFKGLIYVTLGGAGAVRSDPSGTMHYRCPETEPVSATGAGDAFLAGLLRRRLLGTTGGEEDLIAGSACAYLALQCPQSVPPDLSAEMLETLILQWLFKK
jgi:pseudouridine kinase